MNSPVVGAGAMYEGGRFVSDALLRGHAAHGIYAGRRVTDDLAVLISVRHHNWTTALLDALSFAAPGVSALLFVGPPDGYRPPTHSTQSGPLGAIIEQRPAGVPIADRHAPLAPRDVVSVGLGLLATLSAAAQRTVELRGIRPETVYIVDDPAGARLGGITPRTIRLLGYYDDPPYGSPFDGHSYDAPELSEPGDPSPTSDLFSVALTLWAAHAGRHPYRLTRDASDEYVMLNDERDRFPGPEDIGRILERILVADPARRPSVGEVEAEWLDLVRRWDVSPPPFPPPGLL